MNITVYSTPTCPYCISAKKYFSDKKISFTDFDVAKDHQKAEEMIKLSGQMGVPVIVIDPKGAPSGRKVIVGFDQAEIDKLI